MDGPNLELIRMLAQYMGAAGADISAGEPIGKNVNATTQQNIASQSFMALLKNLFGPDGSKATLDKSGMKLTIPQDSALFSSFLKDDRMSPTAGIDLSYGSGGTPPVSTPSTPTQSSSPVQGGMYGSGVGPNIANPFTESQSGGISNISAAGLAGLTPQDISTALGMKFTQDQMQQKSYGDIVNSIYKDAQMKHLEAQTAALTPSVEIPGTGIKLTSKEWIDWKKMDASEKADLVEAKFKEQSRLESAARTKKTELETPSVPVPGLEGVGGPVLLTPKDYIDYLSLDDKQKPDIVKVFEYAKNSQGFSGSIIDFKAEFEKTGHKKDYDDAVASGYDKPYWTWLFDMAKAGALNFGEKLTERRGVGEVERENEVRDPGLFGKITTTLRKNDRAWNATIRVDEMAKKTGKSSEEIRTALQRDMVFKEMDHRIKSVFKDATFIRHKGWVTPDGLIVQRDPYE